MSVHIKRCINTCTFMQHTLTQHTHTHTLSLPLSPSLPHSLSPPSHFSLPPSIPPLSLSNAHSLTFSHIHFPFSLSHTNSLFLSHTHQKHMLIFIQSYVSNDILSTALFTLRMGTIVSSFAFILSTLGYYIYCTCIICTFICLPTRSMVDRQTDTHTHTHTHCCMYMHTMCTLSPKYTKNPVCVCRWRCKCT